jgi:hypothetical protein
MCVLLAVFMALGFSFSGSDPGRLPLNAGTRATTRTGTGAAADTSARTGANAVTGAGDRYTPEELTVTQGRTRGDLVVTWRMPIRPDVVATVIYEGAGTARARAVVNYGSDPSGIPPRTTLHGLPAGQRVCLSAAHVVSVDDKVTSALSSAVCAVPR